MKLKKLFKSFLIKVLKKNDQWMLAIWNKFISYFWKKLNAKFFLKASLFQVISVFWKQILYHLTKQDRDHEMIIAFIIFVP